MNYHSYIFRRISELKGLGFKMQKLFSVLNHSDYEEIQNHLKEIEAILEKQAKLIP